MDVKTSGLRSVHRGERISDAAVARQEEIRQLEEGRAPLGVIHLCLEHIRNRFGLRARLFLQVGDDLVLQDCVGPSLENSAQGLTIRRGNPVWEVFAQGVPVNLTEPQSPTACLQTVPDPIPLKALIPLKSPTQPLRGPGAQGILVVDAGGPETAPWPVDERDFEFLVVLAFLISELLERALREREKRAEADQVAHVFRNRFTAIGGFARRLWKRLPDSILREWALLIVREAEAGEAAVRTWDRG